MFKKIKSFYNKDHLNFYKGYVDPFEFHKIFYQIFTAFQVADFENQNPPSYFTQNAILFIIGLMAIIISLISSYHGLEASDITHSTEAGAYTFVLSHELLVLYCTRRNLTQYHNLLRALQKDFHYICTAGEKYRVPYFENQLKTWKICIIACIFTFAVPIAMISFAFLALFYFLATHDADDEGSRPLLFPVWLPNVDFSKSPVYEMAFMFSNIAVIFFAYNYTFMLLTEIIWIRQIASKVDVIIWNIQDLLVDVHPATNKEESEHFSHLIQNRMKEIVIHHQSMYSVIKDYAIIYKKILLLEQIIAGPLICLSAYCLVEKFDKGEFQVILLLLCFATTVLYFIPSFMCAYLNFKVQSICDACWNIPFWNAEPEIRPYMVLIMQRSLQPLPLQAAGFKEVSLETFSQTMTSAYSCFNMLRQTNL